MLLGTQEDRGVLRYVGKVGSGFSDRALHTIRSFLGRIEVPASTFTDVPSGRGLRFVEPIVVVEVDHAAWTPAGRLRHPRFVGVVLDRADPEVVIAVDDHGRPSSVGRDGCRPPPV